MKYFMVRLKVTCHIEKCKVSVLKLNKLLFNMTFKASGVHSLSYLDDTGSRFSLFFICKANIYLLIE